MSDRAAAIAYLKPPPGSFWKWVDDGRAIAWKNGETIALRQELAAAVARLAPGGLPPFAAIVLLLAATRDNWNATSRQLVEHASALLLPGGGDPTSAVGVTIRAVGHRLEDDTLKLIINLTRVAGLPPELRHPLRAKENLADMGFETSDRAIGADTARQVVSELESAADLEAFNLSPAPYLAVRELVDCIASLKQGLNEVEADQLLLRLRTGLDRLIQPPTEELAPSKRIHHLLSDLSDDPELGGLARVARNLLAAVHVPRSLQRHEHLPTGGVSDISNRGQLDKLLISELANDDLTLAVRVAVNEALYLQRESPPREPPHRRVMLIDTGIRTWGVPRVYATAVAMALAATGDAQGEFACFRPEGERVVPVDLTEREGVIAHLESLETRPHFGLALPSFVREISVVEERSEAFLITQEDVLDDPEFRAAIQQLDRFVGFAATVAREGTFRLWSLSSAGRTLVRQARLDLDELLAPPAKPHAPLIDATADLPVILSIEPFPILLPIDSAVRRIIASPSDDKAALTLDRRLLIWRADGSGARMLSDRMPGGVVKLFRFVDDTTIAAVFQQSSPGVVPQCILSVADTQLGVHPQRQLSGITHAPRAVTLHEETIYVIGRGYGLAYRLNSADPIARLDLTGYQWLQGRIFAKDATRFLLSLTGSALTLEPLPKPVPPRSTVIDAYGTEGPLQISGHGSVRTLGAMTSIRAGLHEPMVIQGLTFDGTAIVAAVAKTGERHYLDLTGKSPWQRLHGSLHSFLTGTNRYWKPTRSLRRYFASVLVDLNGNLVLVTKAGKTSVIQLVAAEMQLVDTRDVRSAAPDTTGFARTTAPRGTGYRLRVATWDDNSKVFLDSRGLLHLKSANPNIPQVTLVLCNDGPMAGWSSDGRVYGPRFFHGSNTSHDPRHLDDLIRQFTRSLI